MTPATTNRRTAAEIAAALTAILTDATLAQAPALAPFGGESEPLFDAVHKFDEAALGEALQQMRVTGRRVAILVVHEESFARVESTARLRLNATLRCTLYIGDRVLGSGDASLWGDDTTPGAWALAAAALPLVVGQVLANPAGVQVFPTAQSPVRIAESETDLPGRAAVAVELLCSNGWIEAPIKPLIPYLT